jgi:hypothetical protein
MAHGGLTGDQWTCGRADGHDRRTWKENAEKNGRYSMRAVRGNKDLLAPDTVLRKKCGLLARYGLAMLQLMLPMSCVGVDERLPCPTGMKAILPVHVIQVQLNLDGLYLSLAWKSLIHTLRGQRKHRLQHCQS